jgi:hypothetical protein
MRRSAGFAVACLAVVTIGANAACDEVADAPPGPGPSRSVARESTSPTVAATFAGICEVARLPQTSKAIAGGDSNASDVDPTGRFIVGYEATSPQSTAPILWDNGVPIRVPVPGDQAFVFGVNSRGVAVGRTHVSGKDAAWVYHDGTVTLPKGGFQAVMVGEGGHIVGHNGQGTVLWSTPTAEPVVLEVPAGWHASAGTVMPDGTVVGYVMPASAEPGSAVGAVGRLWRPDGTATAIAQPTFGDTPLVGLRTLSMDDAWIYGLGVVRVVGSSRTEERPLRINRQTGIAEPYPRGVEIDRASASDFGPWVAGTIQNTDKPAVFSPAGQLVELPVLPGVDQEIAMEVDRDGSVIVGYGIDMGKRQALVWHCR